MSQVISINCDTCRSPHGERGLKLRIISLRGFIKRRSPHGERGLKFTFKTTISRYILRRSPHGERGLK